MAPEPGDGVNDFVKTLPCKDRFGFGGGGDRPGPRRISLERDDKKRKTGP
jgi:hypothetical protein